jgi:hypothetical protein
MATTTAVASPVAAATASVNKAPKQLPAPEFPDIDLLCRQERGTQRGSLSQCSLGRGSRNDCSNPQRRIACGTSARDAWAVIVFRTFIAISTRPASFRGERP